MTNIEYLQSQRMTAEERAEFNVRYGLKDVRDDFPAPSEFYEAHTHHMEYGAARH